MANDPPRLRRATPGDADGMRACLTAAYADFMATIDDLPDVAAACEHEIAVHRVFVAVSGTAIVGVLVLVPQNSFLQVVNLAVHPDQQGSGLGRQLMNRAETEARALGIAEMRLITHSSMESTIAFYHRGGWLQTGRSGNKVSMSKRLADR